MNTKPTKTIIYVIYIQKQRIEVVSKSEQLPFTVINANFHHTAPLIEVLDSNTSVLYEYCPGGGEHRVLAAQLYF